VPGREPATPSLVRAINLRSIFDVVHAGGSVGAPRVVRETGLSRPTVAECLAQLLELGLIRRAGRGRGLPGPGAQLYAVDPRAGWVLSLDIGREWVRCGLSDLTGGWVGRTASRTTAVTAAALIAQLRQVATHLLTEAGIAFEEVDQVVVGTPGVIRPGEGHFWLAPNLPGWESVQVITDLREALVAPVTFENDVNLAAVGEHTQGVARGLRDFVLLSVGTGVGMGVVLDGELRRGAGGLAGEIAYLALDMDAPAAQQVAQWGTGAFERMVSAAAIVGLARDRGLVDARSAADVFRLARAGTTAAQQVIDLVASRLAHAIAAVAAVLDPDLVVLGGGVGSGGGDLLLGPTGRVLARISPFSPRLAVSTLGSDAVLTGASALGLRLTLDGVFERAAGNGRFGEPAARGLGPGVAVAAQPPLDRGGSIAGQPAVVEGPPPAAILAGPPGNPEAMP